MYPRVAISFIVALTTLNASRLVVAQDLPWGINELRLGGAASLNDRPTSGYVQFEALFSPVPSRTAYDPNLSFLLSPRPLVGASISLQGKTNQVFAGLAWKLPISGPLLVEYSVGGLVHDQALFQVYSDRPTLTTRFLFRESIAIGYEINASWRIIAFADHASHGNLGYANRSMNHVGVMVGAKLGEAAEQATASLPSAVSDFSWTGPYTGVSGGMAAGKVNAVIDEPPAASEFSSRRVSSLNLGGHLGYNWAVGSFVTGVEGDISAQNLNTAASRYAPIPEEISASSRWLATVRARIGVNVDQVFHVQRLLLYATGGAAFTRVGKSYCNSVIDKCYINGEVGGGWITEGGIRTGWTAGGGIEIPLAPHASARVEYLYANFGNLSFANGPIRNDIRFSEHVLRAGMSFGFSGH